MGAFLGTAYSTIWTHSSHTIKPGFLPLCDCLFLKERLIHPWATWGNTSAAMLCGQIQHYRSSQWFLRRERHYPCIFLPLRAERVWGEGSKHSWCLGISLKWLLLIHSLQLQPDAQAMRGTRAARLQPQTPARRRRRSQRGSNTSHLPNLPAPSCPWLLAVCCSNAVWTQQWITREVCSSVPCLHLVMLTTPKDA